MGVDGTYQDRFAPVREQFEKNLESGEDVGASVAIVLDGELVVDLWGGTASVSYTHLTLPTIYSV